MARKDALLRLHERLIAKRDNLRAKLVDEPCISRAARSGGDVADVANDGEQTEIDSQLSALESRELIQIEKAIKLIRNGRYGSCEVCGSAIPNERLQALPFTPYCVSCQRELEESGDGNGDIDANWESAYEFEGKLSDRELTLGDIDID